MIDSTIDGLDAEVAEFLSVTTDVLVERDTLGHVRRFLNGESGVDSFDRGRWQELAQLGWTGVALPADCGGEYPLSIAGRLLQVCGRFLLPEPVLSTVGLAVPVLLAQQTSAAAELLTRVGTTDCVVAVAGATEISVGSLPPALEIHEREGTLLVSGTVNALDVPGADVVLAVAAVDGGWRWLALDPDAATRATSRTLIDGRGVARLEFEEVEVASAPLGPVSTAELAWEPVLVAGSVLTSAWLLGITERAFELTVDYLKTRSQFGALIGSYQALQHRASRLFCELEVARSVVGVALAALDSGAEDTALWASAAKTRVGDLAVHMTSEAIQLHGGIGMTHEADIGLYFKAARIANTIAGDNAFHRTRASQLLNIVTPQNGQHDHH
jgi:alkylation response protein AidB-like acyl-CoA dehydrogenase